MLTYSEERSLIDDIKEGIEIAMHRQNVSAEAIDPIKVNKLAYLAIQEFDLGITYGWYKYGPAPVDVAGHTDTSTPSIELEPRPETQVRAYDRSRVPSEKHEHKSPEEYAEYFENLDAFYTIAETETKVYLEQFYETFAPERFKPLYLTSIRLQQLMDQIDEDGWEEFNDEFVKELTSRLNSLYAEILQSPELDESVEPFKRYKRLLKNVTSIAACQDTVIEPQQRFISEAIEFFYNEAWRYVALLVSKDTVTGENADRLRNSIDNNLSELRNTFKSDIDELNERSRLFGLQPQARRNIEKFQDGNLGNSEEYQNPENWEAWSKLGSEVVRN